MKRPIQAFGPSVMLLLAGCGIETAARFSCDHSAKKPLCVDYENVAPVADSLKEDCTQAGGTVMTSLCPRTGVIGGCTASDKGFVVTSWYYGGISAALLMQTCSTSGGTFVSE